MSVFSCVAPSGLEYCCIFHRGLCFACPRLTCSAPSGLLGIPTMDLKNHTPQLAYAFIRAVYSDTRMCKPSHTCFAATTLYIDIDDDYSKLKSVCSPHGCYSTIGKGTEISLLTRGFRFNSIEYRLRPSVPRLGNHHEGYIMSCRKRCAPALCPRLDGESHPLRGRLASSL